MRQCVSMDHKQHTLRGEMTERAQSTAGLSDYRYSELRIAPDPLWDQEKSREGSCLDWDDGQVCVISPLSRVSWFSVFAHLGMPYLHSLLQPAIVITSFFTCSIPRQSADPVCSLNRRKIVSAGRVVHHLALLAHTFLFIQSYIFV